MPPSQKSSSTHYDSRDNGRDYGDYGWMEWDSSEMQWYIEVSDGEWEPLPEEYDRARLWHVE